MSTVITFADEWFTRLINNDGSGLVSEGCCICGRTNGTHNNRICSKEAREVVLPMLSSLPNPHLYQVKTMNRCVKTDRQIGGCGSLRRKEHRFFVENNSRMTAVVEIYSSRSKPLLPHNFFESVIMEPLAREAKTTAINLGTKMRGQLGNTIWRFLAAHLRLVQLNSPFLRSKGMFGKVLALLKRYIICNGDAHDFHFEQMKGISEDESGEAPEGNFCRT